MPRWPKRKLRPGVDEYGRTPLWNLAFAGDLAEMRRELAGGANPNQGDDAGYTPLHVAIQEKRVEAVTLLLENGADPNRADNHGNVPLWTAVQNWGKDDRVILLLLRAGADPRVENNYGCSPFSVVRGMRGEIGELVAARYSQDAEPGAALS
ncbi:MAG: ankyrin repeat domain-containing protein [Gemmataceae bacterium]|nr:ankyrin repeat domain-containing protein [Gemmataceae bacterium]